MNISRGSSIFRFCGKVFQYVQPIYNKNFLQFYIQERQFAARKGKRAAMLLAKKQRKLTQPPKPKRIPPHMLRKATVRLEQQQTRSRDENWFETKPIDNVWRTALYRGKPYTFDESITMFREVHHPSILNHVDAFVYTRVEFDLRLKKKDNYLEAFNGVITYPSKFETGWMNKIVAICRSEEDQLKATEAGAIYAGSTALIKRILSGEIYSEDYDYVVCHPDSYKELNVLRGLLKRNYPNAHNGLLRLDVDKAVASFARGMKYTSDRSVVELDFGWTDVCFGRLNMDLSTLESNFSHLLNVLLTHKPTGTSYPFITKTTLWCEKTTERYKVPHVKYLPGYEDNTEESTEDLEKNTQTNTATS